jgi:gamma-glutamyl-gamma-aminobutyraldehyde dehydrogenase
LNRCARPEDHHRPDRSGVSHEPADHRRIQGHRRRSVLSDTTAFIDGHFRPAISGKTFDTLNPATGAVLAKVAACGPEDVDLAVSQGPRRLRGWPLVAPAPERAQGSADPAGKLVKRNARELAVLESLDSGKTIYDCEQVDVPETINCLTWHAELIDKIYDQVAPASTTTSP